MSTKPGTSTFPSLDLGALARRYEDGARPAEVLAERGEEAIAVVCEQGLHGLQLLAPPLDRPGGP